MTRSRGRATHPSVEYAFPGTSSHSSSERRVAAPRSHARSGCHSASLRHGGVRWFVTREPPTLLRPKWLAVVFPELGQKLGGLGLRQVLGPALSGPLVDAGAQVIARDVLPTASALESAQLPRRHTVTDGRRVAVSRTVAVRAWLGGAAVHLESDAKEGRALLERVRSGCLQVVGHRHMTTFAVERDARTPECHLRHAASRELGDHDDLVVLHLAVAHLERPFVVKSEIQASNDGSDVDVRELLAVSSLASFDLGRLERPAENLLVHVVLLQSCSGRRMVMTGASSSPGPQMAFSVTSSGSGLVVTT